MGAPIKTLGAHQVSVRLHPEVAAKVDVEVVAARDPPVPAGRVDGGRHPGRSVTEGRTPFTGVRPSVVP